MAFSPDRTTLASAAADKTVRFWDVSHVKELGRVTKPKEVHRLDFPPTWVTLSPVVIKPKEVRRFDAAATCVTYSPDGALLAVALADGTARLFEGNSSRMLASLGKPGQASRVAFSPDGRVLAAGGKDSSVTLWDVSNLLERPARSSTTAGGGR